MSSSDADKYLVLSQVSGPCVCSQLRRTARKVSNFYDRALAPAGLTVTQHAILVTIARAATIGRSSLADHLGMDRTTLTRNLRPLEKQKLVVPVPTVDRRKRELRLSSAGRLRLKKSYSCWELAQSQFTQKLGADTLNELRTALAATEAAADDKSPDILFRR